MSPRQKHVTSLLIDASCSSTNDPLKTWLEANRKNPYPSNSVKHELALKSNKTITQVTTWFANHRRRMKGDAERLQECKGKPVIKKKHKKKVEHKTDLSPKTHHGAFHSEIVQPYNLPQVPYHYMFPLYPIDTRGAGMMTNSFIPPPSIPIEIPRYPLAEIDPLSGFSSLNQNLTTSFPSVVLTPRSEDRSCLSGASPSGTSTNLSPRSIPADSPKTAPSRHSKIWSIEEMIK